MQRAAVFDQEGGERKIMIGRLRFPEPGPGELRIKVSAFGLNQADILLTEGRHYVTSELPVPLGYEACGIVDAVGEGVTRFRVGDRVSTVANAEGPYSCGAEYALALERFVLPWPDGFSAPEACAFSVQYLTAYYPYAKIFSIGPGSWVMVTAATGGTGLGAVVMAKHFGANVIATTRTSAKRDVLLEHGADAVVATDEEELAEAMMRVTNGHGVDLVNDSIGGPFIGRYIEGLAYNGRVYVHGGLSGTNIAHFDVLPLVRRRAALHGFSLINETRDPESLEEGKSYILRALASGALRKPLIDSVFAFEDAPQAYARMRSGAQRGKIVCMVGEAA